MTPAELKHIAESFRREEERGQYVFQVVQGATGFMANVRPYGAHPVAVVGGVVMPNGDVSPWIVTAGNDKQMLPLVPFERARDLVRRLLVAVEKAPEPVVLGTEHATSCRCPACSDDEPHTVH